MERRGRAPTLTDVALRAGVSVAHAARALGNYGRVRQSTRQRVRAAADDLGYRPNPVARSMVTGRTHTLGVVLADIENPFFARAVRSITDAARQHGFEVVLANTDEEIEAERSAVALLADKMMDGLIVAPASPSRYDHLQLAQELGCAVVLIDRRVRGFRADSIVVDNRAATRRAVDRLLAAGHRRIGYVSGMTHGRRDGSAIISSGAERLRGYREALRDHGLTIGTELIRFGGPHREDVKNQTLTLLRQHPAPTALFAADSLIALGVLEAIRDRGLDIPHDVSLVAFDDAAWAPVLEPPLSVVEQPVYALGQRAIELMLRRIANPGLPLRQEVLATAFIDRQSIGPPSADSRD
jgi:LacI family transcriptional regulator